MISRGAIFSNYLIMRSTSGKLIYEDGLVGSFVYEGSRSWRTLSRLVSTKAKSVFQIQPRREQFPKWGEMKPIAM